MSTSFARDVRSGSRARRLATWSFQRGCSWSVVLPLLAVLAAVIASFMASTAYVEHRNMDIQADAASIAENVAPSVERLGAVRADLRLFQVLLGDFVNDAVVGKHGDRSAVDDARAKLELDLGALARLPAYPTEQVRLDMVSHALADVDALAGRVLDLVRAGAAREANELADGPLRLAFDRAGSSVQDAFDLNVDEAHHRARAIEASREHTRWIAFRLDQLCALFSLVLGAAGIGFVKHHVSLLRAHQALLERRADELEKFSGTVAHDVLSPLTGATLALDVAARKLAEDGAARTAIDRGRRSVTRVRLLVEGLLVFARSGATPEPDAQTDAGAVVADVANELEPEALEAGAELCVEPTPPCAVAASPAVVTSLCANLARNAIKYLGDAAVRRVTLRVLDRGDAVRVEVEDTGPGIPPAIEHTLFEPFCRAPGATGPGIGLGLATVRRLAVAHGGRVGFRSSVGHGSLLWFELPKAAPPHPRSEPLPAATDPPR